MRRPRPARVALAALLLLLLAPCGASAQAEHLRVLSDRFRRDLGAIAARTSGVLGVAAVDLTTGERFGVNEALEFPQGSAIKVAILLELYRQAGAGKLSLRERIPVRAAEQVPGSGVAHSFADGASQLALHDLAVLMVVLSDNTATNLLIDRVGMENVNRLLRELGAQRTRLQRKMIRPAESAAGRENLSTPAEAAALMARLHSCSLPISPAACAEVRGILEIPKEGGFPQPIAPGVRVAWKPGSIEGVATAWGLVALPGRPYAIAVMTNYSDSDDTAEAAVREVSAAAFAYFNRLARTTPYGTRVPLDLLEQGDTAVRR